jgi:UDP-glucose 4-epimerase
METILVTGGAGAIGSRLVAKLCKEHKVLVLDDLSSGWHDNIADLPARFWRGSVIDEEILREVFASKPSVIFHLAANFANQNSVDYPQKDLMVNGLGTLKLLQYARDTGVKRFIYTSSSCVYGNNERLSETSKNFSLDTPYAVTKLLGEQYVRFFALHHKMETVILRLFNSYGPGEYPGKYRNVIPNFLFRAVKNEPLVITGTGDETRDFTFVDDTVIALQLAMTRPEAVGETFNVGTGRETAIRTLAETIIEISGSKSEIQYRPRRDWDEVARRCADVSHIKSTLGFTPATDMRAGLASTHEWFSEKRLARFTPPL